MRYSIVETPIGPLLVAAAGDALASISFAKGGRAAEPHADWTRDDDALTFAASQLAEWFACKRRTFDLPLAPRGTDFQQSVWRELQSIPYGETRSYLDVARAIGRPDAVRAVGTANGANPIPIVIPCHRVVGSNGSLTGFGGGIDVKRWLLAMESNQSRLIQPPPKHKSPS